MAILGIDEVGRGPWAGPLVIGAVILGENEKSWWKDLTDSKKLSIKKREALNEKIIKEAPALGLGWVFSYELDKFGLKNSLSLATRRAVKNILNLKVPFSEIIIDGTVNFLKDTPLASHTTTLKKADLLIREVSAASIVAKVARDHYMYNLKNLYPDYGFEKHVGYGTALHKSALEKFGPCPEHRKSFKPLKSYLPPNEAPEKDFSIKPTTTSLGKNAEQKVADYLVSKGHIIIAKNQKSRFYEIDIISIKDQNIYFTEVKYRKNEARGTPLEQITRKKQKQMRFAAESFLNFQPGFKNFNPYLAVAAVEGIDFTLLDWFILT